jgi:hypothetical protein
MLQIDSIDFSRWSFDFCLRLLTGKITEDTIAISTFPFFANAQPFSTPSDSEGIECSINVKGSAVRRGCSQIS